MMDHPHPAGTSALRRSARRSLLTPDGGALDAERLLPECGDLPLVLTPAVPEVDLLDWASIQRAAIQQKLLRHGGLLFRGFQPDTPERFERLVETISGPLLTYTERSSPRSHVAGRIYTSTDYPPDQEIFLHNENSYQNNWPLRIGFYCATPPEEGGETPIADVRRVLRRIAPDTRQRFIERRILYVRNFRPGLGLPWHTVFQTTDRATVDEYCALAGIDTEWTHDDRLVTRQVREAVALHPVTGDMLWFNHATFFHASTLDPIVRHELGAEFGEDQLPFNTYYGDGGAIEPAALEELRRAYREEAVMFRWQRGDILLLDNMLVAHGRRPYTGNRRILVAMAAPHARPVR